MRAAFVASHKIVEHRSSASNLDFGNLLITQFGEKHGRRTYPFNY